MTDGAPSTSLTLPVGRRLRRKSEFDAVYASGRRLGNGFFGVVALANGARGPRLGLAVAVRAAGGGVERNRFRRIIRESFRLHQHELPPVDIVVSLRPRCREVAAAALREGLCSLWKKVSEQCAPSRKV